MYRLGFTPQESVLRTALHGIYTVHYTYSDAPSAVHIYNTQLDSRIIDHMFTVVHQIPQSNVLSTHYITPEQC